MLESSDGQQANSSETDANISLQPMRLMGILGAMFSLYRKHFWRFLGSSALYFVVEALLFSLPLVVFFAYIANMDGILEDPAAGSAIAVRLIVATIFIVVACGEVAVLFSAELFVANARLYLGQPAPFRVTFRQALHRYGSYLGSTILLSLVCGALAITLLGIPVAIYLGVRWSLYHIPLLIEKHPALKAWNQSRELVKGTWGRVFGTLLIFQLLVFGIGFILEKFTALLAGQVPVLGGMTMILQQLILWFGGVFGAFILLMPLISMGITILYYDLRVRKEGIDIEMITANMEESSAPPVKTKVFLSLIFLFLGLGFLIVFTFLDVPHATTQEDTTSGLHDGVKARLGKGHMTGNIAFSPDGEHLAVGCSLGIWLYNADTGEELDRFTGPGHTRDVTSVAFSPDGKTIASASKDDTTRLWDVGNGKELRIFIGHTGDITSVAFSPDGKTIASASKDDTIRLWDAGTGESLHTLIGHMRDVTSVAFSPDGKTIASGGVYGTIRLWDAGTAEPLRTFTGHRYSVLSVAFSPDGKIIASGSWGKIRLWSLKTGKHLRTLTGNTEHVKSVAFSPDGKTIASASKDDTIRLWTVETGGLLRTLTGHTNEVLSVSFSPDGKILASGSLDGTVLLWRLVTGKAAFDEDNEWVGKWTIEKIDDHNMKEARALAEALGVSFEMLLAFDDDGTWWAKFTIESPGESEIDRATGTYALNGSNYTMSGTGNIFSTAPDTDLDETGPFEGTGTWMRKGYTLTLTHNDGPVIVLKKQVIVLKE